MLCVDTGNNSESALLEVSHVNAWGHQIGSMDVLQLLTALVMVTFALLFAKEKVNDTSFCAEGSVSPKGRPEVWNIVLTLLPRINEMGLEGKVDTAWPQKGCSPWIIGTSQDKSRTRFSRPEAKRTPWRVTTQILITYHRPAHKSHTSGASSFGRSVFAGSPASSCD